MPRLQLARLRLHQLPRILAIENAAFPREAYDRSTFLDLYLECGSLFFTVRRGRALIGYIVTCVENGKAEIVSIAVHPAHRGCGAGRALMRRTLLRLKQLGIVRVHLMVRVTNTAAIAFYRGFHFVRVRRVPAYYDDGADALLFRLLLS